MDYEKHDQNLSKYNFLLNYAQNSTIPMLQNIKMLAYEP